MPWDIAAGFVIMLVAAFCRCLAQSRWLGFLGMKKSTPFGLGTSVTIPCTFRMFTVRDVRNYRGIIVLASRRTWTVGRARRPDSLRRLTFMTVYGSSAKLTPRAKRN